MKPQKLIVAMNGIEVGALFRDGRGAMSFQYLQSWLNRSGARAISLSLTLTSKKQEGTAVYNFSVICYQTLTSSLLVCSNVFRSRQIIHLIY